MPSSPAHSTASSWQNDPAPLRRHSITELLHDPRATTVAAPIPPPVLPPRPAPLTINDFADYLRVVDAPYRAFLSSRASDASSAASEARRRSRSQPRSTIVTDDPSAASHPPLPPTVPRVYFDPSYAISNSPDLASLDLPLSSPSASSSPAVSTLRDTFAARRALLESQLHSALAAHASQISTATDTINTLRSQLSSTRASAASARDAARALSVSVAGDAPVTAQLGDRRDNAVVLAGALRRVARVRAAAHDAHALVDAAEYPAAMRTVRVARRALAARGGELSRVAALAPARVALARAVERIDAALREHIRVLISADLEAVAGVQQDAAPPGTPRKGMMAPDDGGADASRAASVHELAKLVARLGTSALAHRSFLDDVKRSLAEQLDAAVSLDAAAGFARFAARRAALVHSVFSAEDAAVEAGPKERVGVDGVPAGGKAKSESVSESIDRLNGRGREGAGGEDELVTVDADDEASDDDEDDLVAVQEKRNQDMRRNRENLRELYDAILDMMCGVIDRLVGTLNPESCEFIVLLHEDDVDEANFFDEAKGALRFGEMMRNLDGLAADLALIFGFDALKGDRNQKGEGQSNGDGRANALRSKISERSLAFVNALHKAHSDALTTAMHTEKWVEAKVSVGTLRLVACLTGDSLPALVDDGEAPSASSAEAGVTPRGRRLASAFVVHDEQFKTVGAGSRYVRSVCAFALVVDKLPFASSEAARRGVDLTRLFNSLSSRAILGASALQWAGLRSITARHLALASRTVSLATALAPHIGAPFQNAVVESQVAVVGSLMEQIDRDMRKHHAQLVAKILFIMMERLSVHEEALGALPWGKSLEMQRFEIPSQYVTTLAKEATVLHRILWSILPRGEVFDIFERVCEAYGSRLSTKYSKLDGGKPWIRKRVMEDVHHLHQRLAGLDALKAKSEAFKPIEKLHQQFYFDLRDADKEGAAATGRGPVPSSQGKPPVAISGPKLVLETGSSDFAPAGMPASPVPPSPLPPSMAAADVLSPPVLEDAPQKGAFVTASGCRTSSQVLPEAPGPQTNGITAPGEKRRFLSRSSLDAMTTGDVAVALASGKVEGLAEDLPGAGAMAPTPSEAIEPLSSGGSDGNGRAAKEEEKLISPVASPQSRPAVSLEAVSSEPQSDLLADIHSTSSSTRKAPGTSAPAHVGSTEDLLPRASGRELEGNGRNTLQPGGEEKRIDVSGSGIAD